MGGYARGGGSSGANAGPSGMAADAMIRTAVLVGISSVAAADPAMLATDVQLDIDAHPVCDDGALQEAVDDIASQALWLPLDGDSLAAPACLLRALGAPCAE